MYYLMKFLTLLDAYRLAILSALFGALLLFGFINWIYNPYRKQNKKLRKCTSGIRSYPARTAYYAAGLPADYRRQWRAFVNCGTDKPALIFEFIPKRKRMVGVYPFVAIAVAMTLYIAVFAAVRTDFTYLVIQAAFWFAFALIMIANKAIERRYLRISKHIFAQFVSQLSVATPRKPATVAEDTVKEIKKLNKGEVNDAAVGKASELLHEKGLEEERTVEEQQKLNLALNGLLQAYAKNAQHKPV